MKILYYDCFSGISGDMNLAAMIDIGVDLEYIKTELNKLHIDGYNIQCFPDERKGITGTRVDVILSNIDKPEHQHHSHEHRSFFHRINIFRKHTHQHSHVHSHGGHKHSNHHHHNDNRNFIEISNLIKKSALSDKVKDMSISIFRKVAEAEAKIHGKTIEDVHFHEVGAVDSIVDIVGAAICIDFLKPDKIIASTIELGGGFVKCAHGTFPVPAPATMEILKNIPVSMGAVRVETTTPTGAAILATIVDEFVQQPSLVIDKIAYGIGHRKTVIPNVLRLSIGHENEKQNVVENQKSSEIKNLADVIECNIDDMNPETYDFVIEKLFQAGADDVYLQNIQMKKNRPAITLCVLCNKSLTNTLGSIIFTHTTTLGYRSYEVEKRILDRETQILKTKWGNVHIKQGILNGNVIKSKPEYDDCLKISKENNLSLIDVYNEINSLINNTKL